MSVSMPKIVLRQCGKWIALREGLLRHLRLLEFQKIWYDGMIRIEKPSHFV